MIDAAHDDLCHAADPCVFRDLHRRSRPVHHGNLRPCCLRQVQIAAQLLYIPVVKKFCRTCLVWRFRQTFPHPKKPLHIPMLGMPAPLGVVVRRFIHQDSWNLVNINPPGVECRGIRFSYSARPPVRSAGTMYPVLHAGLHIAHHQISALFLRLMRRLRQGIRFAHAGRIAKRIFSLPGGSSASGSWEIRAFIVCPSPMYSPSHNSS